LNYIPVQALKKSKEKREIFRQPSIKFHVILIRIDVLPVVTVLMSAPYHCLVNMMWDSQNVKLPLNHTLKPFRGAMLLLKEALPLAKPPALPMLVHRALLH
jgi:hypothetical protein